MKRSTILGLLAVITACTALTAPAGAHGNDRRGYDYGRRDARHDREHSKLAEKHDRAHDRGFYSRREHDRLHRKASNKHDVIHHRVYGEHAPERRRGSRYYNPDSYYRYGGSGQSRYDRYRRYDDCD